MNSSPYTSLTLYPPSVGRAPRLVELPVTDNASGMNLPDSSRLSKPRANARSPAGSDTMLPVMLTVNSWVSVSPLECSSWNRYSCRAWLFVNPPWPSTPNGRNGFQGVQVPSVVPKGIGAAGVPHCTWPCAFRNDGPTAL